MAAAIELQLSELGVNTINRDRIKGPNGQKTANLFAFVPGTADGPILGFNAHMDRVEPGKNIKPREKNGKIISSGKTILAADDVVIPVWRRHALRRNAVIRKTRVKRHQGV